MSPNQRCAALVSGLAALLVVSAVLYASHPQAEPRVVNHDASYNAARVTSVMWCGEWAMTSVGEGMTKMTPVGDGKNTVTVSVGQHTEAKRFQHEMRPESFVVFDGSKFVVSVTGKLTVR